MHTRSFPKSYAFGACFMGCVLTSLSQTGDTKTAHEGLPKPLYGPLRTPTTPQASPRVPFSDRSNWKRTGDGKLQAPIRKPSAPVKAALPNLKPEEPLITVNGEVLTWGIAKRYADLQTASFRMPPGVTVEDFEAEKENITRRHVLKIAEHYISKTVLAQEARRHNLSLTSAEFDSKKAEMAARIRQDSPKPELFLKELETPGSFMLIDMTNLLLTAKLSKEIIRPSLVVSDADAAQYIAQRESDNQAIKKFNAGLRPKITGLLKQLQEGASFADTAFAESDCSSSSEGGEWGTFKRGDIRPEITDAAFQMKEGDLSDIVETPYSYHILKLIKKNRGFVAKGSTEPAPVISVKLAHIMLEKKETLPTLDSASAKDELLTKREKEALAQLKERLIKSAKIVTPLPLY